MKKALVFALFFLKNLVLNAQTALISEPIQIRNDYGYEIIGRLKDNVLLFRDRFDEFEIQAFDTRMQLDWDKEIQLGKRGVQVLAVIGGRDDFSIVFKIKQHNSIVLRLHKYDSDANLLDSTTLKIYPTTLFSSPKLEVFKSEDKNCLLVFDVATQPELDATCFLVDKMKVLWNKKIVSTDDFQAKNVADMCLSNTGDFYLIRDENNRKAKLDEHHFSIRKINAAEQEQAWEIAAHDFLTFDVRFEFDEENRRLVGAGLFGEKNTERANGYFILALKPDGSSPTVRTEPFDDAFLSILKQKEVESDKSGLVELDVQSLFFRRDGGAVFVCEQNHEIERGSVSGRGSVLNAPHLIVDYYFDDFFVVSTQPDGSPQWKTVLHKKQYSQDDEGIFSSFFMLKTPDRLRFLFNDDIKYETSCSEYQLDPAGRFDRNALLNTEGQNLRLRFRDALQIGPREVLVPSEYRSKLRLVLVRFEPEKM